MQPFFIPVLIVVALIILGQIYFFGRYLATRQEIFTNNFYAAFSLGFTLYFAVTFLLLLPLIWVGAPIAFYVALFAVKDGAQILFLTLRRTTFSKKAPHWRELSVILIGAAILLLSFNLGITNIRPLSYSNNTQGFPTWASFKELISVITTIDFNFVQRWLGGLLVAALAMSATGSCVSFFAKRASIGVAFFTLVINVGILLTLNFQNQLEALANVFLIIFSLVVVLHINIYSRRRYGATFGLIVFAAWSFNPNYFLALLTIAFTSAMLYTLMKKPKPLLFWVQLLAPLAATSTLWISSEYSLALGIVITILAVIAYVFITAVGRIESLVRIDQFVIKTRYILPPLIIATLLAVCLGYGLSSAASSVNTILQTSYLFNDFQNTNARWINVALMAAVAVTSFSMNIWRALIKRQLTITRFDLAWFSISLMILFTINPGFGLLTNRSEIVSAQQNYLAAIISPLLLAMIAGWALNTIDQKLIQAYRQKKYLAFSRTYTRSVA